MRGLILWILILLDLPTASARSLLAGLPLLGEATVTAVSDDLTLTLADGRTIRLAGLHPLESRLGAPAGAEPDPVLVAARTLLTQAAAGAAVRLRGDDHSLDRYGRLGAQVERADGVWLQAILVEAGLAMVDPGAGGGPVVAKALLRREARARQRRLGWWQDQRHWPRTPADLPYASGDFALVDARILSATPRRGELWFDLGPAAARLDHDGLTRAQIRGLDLTGIAGAWVRLRGWVRFEGRPVVDLADPAAIEILPGPPAQRTRLRSKHQPPAQPGPIPGPLP